MSDYMMGLGIALLLGAVIGWYHNTTSQLESSVVARVHKAMDVPTPKIALKNTHAPTASSLQPQAEPLVEPTDNVESIMEYLLARTRNKNYSPLGEKRVRALLRTKPELAEKLLVQLVTTNDPQVHQVLQRMLTVVHLTNAPSLEDFIISKIKLGERVSDWSALISNWGLDKPQNISYMNKQLNYLLEPTEIRNSIMALSHSIPVHGTALTPETRNYITQNLQQYVYSPNKEIRAAAITSLKVYPPNDMKNILQDALLDRSSKVRQAAVSVFAHRMPSSNQLRNSVMQIMQDTSMPILERQAAQSHLSNMQLSSLERELVNTTGIEIQNYLLDLNQEELDGLIEELE